MTQNLNALVLAHEELKKYVKEGNVCVDATAGRGQDTAFLCSLVGETGKVMAFDIQEEALDSTRIRLEERGYLERSRLILDSHSQMEKYVEPETVDAVTFNFGWLPGGNHKVMTLPESSIPAIEAGLRVLRPGGIMSLIIYYGGDSGFVERDALLEYLPTIDHLKYTVLITQFSNRPHNPPIPVMIYKNI